MLAVSVLAKLGLCACVVLDFVSAMAKGIERSFQKVSAMDQRECVTLSPEQAEKLYVAFEAVQNLAQLIESEDQVLENLLRILGEQLTDVISDVSFPFED